MTTSLLQSTPTGKIAINGDSKKAFPDIRTPITPVQKAVTELLRSLRDPYNIQSTVLEITNDLRIITLLDAIMKAQQDTLQVLTNKLAIARGKTPEVSVDKEEPQVVLGKEVLQSLRDEVRDMVSKWTPKENIPLYRGKNPDGVAIDFFKEHYAQYIVLGNEVIFAKDLANIDDRLLRAMRNEARNGGVMPIGTVSDLINALEKGRFEDGKNPQKRIRDARVQAQVREGYSKKK